MTDGNGRTQDMRWCIAAAMAAFLVAGCGKDREQISHGKPVSYWLGELKQPDAKARKKAVQALGHVGKADPAALKAVAEAVQDRDPAVRREALTALMNLGPDAREVESAVEAAARDSDPTVRALAGKALERIRGNG
jgi:HEAT repeat protein